MRKANLSMLCSVWLLMTSFILSYHASAESSTTIQQMPRPLNNALEIRDTRWNHIDNTKSGERYEVQMNIRNSDVSWNAAEVCVYVRFRDPAKKLVDAHQTSCLQNLKPLEQRRFTVTYTGSFPRFVSRVIPEPQVASVKWVSNE